MIHRVHRGPTLSVPPPLEGWLTELYKVLKLEKGEIHNTLINIFEGTHFRIEPRVAIEVPKKILKVAMKLLSILRIQLAKFSTDFWLDVRKQAKLGKPDKSC